MNGLHNLSALLEHGANIDAVDNYGNTPLIQASSATLKEECLLLIERGAKLDIKNNNGESALLGAIMRTEIGSKFIETENIAKDIYIALIDHGADIEMRDNKGCTPLYIAARYQRYDVLLDLMDRGANIDAKDNQGRTPLSVAAENGNINSCLALLERGADVNSKDNDGCTPLHAASNVDGKMYAANNLYLDICLALINRGADIGAKDNDGMSVLSRAVLRIGEFGKNKKTDDYATDICLTLIANGASTTDNIVKVRGGDVSLWSLLNDAALKDNGVLLTKLLEADSDPKTLPDRAAKALHIATEGNKHESMAILNSWISRQAAMAAIAEFPEPSIEPTSPQEVAARSVETMSLIAVQTLKMPLKSR
jgi:ankyrin repeat protein